MDCKDINYRNIPVQGDVISGIIRLDPGSTQCFRDLDKYLKSDQGVATLVLKVVNSPMYSRGRQVASIPVAITVLGFNVVRSLAMLAFSRSIFSGSKDSRFRLHIWQHSLLTAIAGRNICTALDGGAFRDEILIAGLMHDMGKVMLFNHAPALYDGVLERMLNQGISCIEAERETFGCDHCEIGREAARQWNLPERFANFMGTDLATLSGELDADPVMRALATANALVKGAGVGAPPGKSLEEREAMLKDMGVPQALCDEWLTSEFMAGLMEDDTYQLCASL